MSCRAVLPSISYELFANELSKQKKYGQQSVLLALSAIAKEYDSYILANPVNETSFAHFLRSDVQSKIHSIRMRTERTGFLDGFIAPNTNFPFRPLTFLYKNVCYIAVKRREKNILTLNPLSEDAIIQASCYEDGSFIVSDIDLLFIIPRKTLNPRMTLDSVYGELTFDEKRVIEGINGAFSSNFKLIAHGPANRFSGSKTSHIHFPILVVTPEGSLFSLGKEENRHQSLQILFRFLHKIRTKGYKSTLNPNWRLND